jgi:hypothetical protein
MASLFKKFGNVSQLEPNKSDSKVLTSEMDMAESRFTR